MITPMIRTPQLVFRVSCACGGTDQGGFDNYPAACAAKERLIKSGANCICGGNAWGIYWRSEWLPDPIATVRQVHPYAYCRPPVGPGFAWAVMEHAAAPWGPVIAEGPTEAAAWLAAAERVCG